MKKRMTYNTAGIITCKNVSAKYFSNIYKILKQSTSFYIANISTRNYPTKYS